MALIINFLIQLGLIVPAVIICAAFTAQHELEQRNTFIYQKPKIVKKDHVKTVPLMTPHFIDNVEVSPVMPAYNEEKRMSKTVEETIKY